MNIYEGFETYKTYISIRNHFKQDDYDYFKYNGQSKVSTDSFLKRRDKFFFAKLQRKLSKEERVYFFVSNFIIDDSNWSGSLVTEQSMTVYNDWKKRIQSLSYTFKEDIDKLKDIVDSSGKVFDNLFEAGNSHPPLLKLYLGKEVSLETMVIMNKVLGYVKRWSQQLSDDVIWKESHRLIAKYNGFVNVDLDKYKLILKQTFL